MTADRKTGRSSRRSRGRPRRQDVVEIEHQLLDVALGEFLEHGYGGASLSRIVVKAGVSKTTLYSRYASKRELFHAIIERQIDRLSPATLLNEGPGKPDLVRGLRDYANHMLELSMESDLLGVNRLMYSESHRFPELGAEAAERSRLGINRIASFIRDCAEADHIPCKDPESVAEVFILTIRGWYINVMLTNQKVSSSERKKWVDRVIRALVSSRRDW